MHSKKRQKMLVFFASLLASLNAYANDGFYQGAGNTLIPTNNAKAHVIREDLDITPIDKCFPVLLPADLFDKKGAIEDQSRSLELGKERPCSLQKNINEVLETKWHARASYEIISIEDQTNVQFGFPVPYWSYTTRDTDGRVDLDVPAVANFETFQDKEQIKNLEIKNVLAPSFFEPEKIQTLPAYVWHTDLAANRKIHLLTEYDFGSDYTADFFEGSHYPKGKLLWFNTRSAVEIKYGFVNVGPGESILYFLHPLKLWGDPAPEEVRARVATPPGMPIFYMIPNTSGVYCVDKKALYFRWKNAVPDEDMKITYPVSNMLGTKNKFHYSEISTDAQFSAWEDLLSSKASPGTKARFSCDLIDELRKNMPKKSFFNGWVSNGLIQCVKSCDE